MSRVVYGDLVSEGLELIERDGMYFLHYDAGAHQLAWREDQLSKAEADKLQLGKRQEYEVILALQARLLAAGQNPHELNWYPASTSQNPPKTH